MRKELVNYPIGRGKETVYHPNVKANVQPKVIKTFTRDGVRFYTDDAGKDHVADTYDKVWGKRETSAILPQAKRAYQRTFRPRR
jgi:hypothetical protein